MGFLCVFKCLRKFFDVLFVFQWVSVGFDLCWFVSM